MRIWPSNENAKISINHAIRNIMEIKFHVFKGIWRVPGYKFPKPTWLDPSDAGCERRGPVWESRYVNSLQTCGGSVWAPQAPRVSRSGQTAGEVCLCHYYLQKSFVNLDIRIKGFKIIYTTCTHMSIKGALQLQNVVQMLAVTIILMTLAFCFI